MLLSMNKKITTIDDLAMMMEKESCAAKKRFGILEEKIEGVAVEMKNIKVEIKEIRGDIKDIQSDIDGIRSEVKNIHTDITTIDTRTAVIDLGVRVGKLEGSV